MAVHGGWRRWIIVLIFAAALAAAALHFGQVTQFAQLLRRAEPLWLLAALGLQALTYLCVAAGWRFVLRAGGSALPLGRLWLLALAKLFTDQAVPAAGMGGNFLMIDRLVAAGVPRGNAAAALIVSTIGFYGSFALFGLVALVLLWLHDDASLLLATSISLLFVAAAAIPASMLWLRRRSSRSLPKRLAQTRFFRAMIETVEAAPSELLRDRGLIARVAAVNGLIFIADAATLFVCLLAVGQPEPFAAAFIALIMAQIATIVGPPLGLGAFEGVSIAMLHLLGVPFEAAFTATLLLRGFTLWLPFLPGIIVTRRIARWGRGGD